MVLSKECFEYFESKISFAACMDYWLEKVSRATSIELVRGIIAGPNMKYKCIDVEQSSYIFQVMRSNLVEICKKTKRGNSVYGSKEL